VSGPARIRVSDDRGFTLLELLIAMTLLGLLMLGLFGGLRLGVRVWEAGDAQAADRSRIEAVQRFIRTYLSQARPLSAADRTGDDVISFIGRRDQLDFTAALPAHLSAGGFEHVALSFAELDDGRGLVLRHGPLRRRDDGRAELFELDDPETAVLLADVTEVEFSYFGAPDQRDDAEWTDRWEDQERLPLLVRIRIGLAGSDRRVWPELTVPLRIQGETSTAPRGPRR
jgi:general secretion pathway protein J